MALTFEEKIIKSSNSYADFSVVLSKAFKQKKNRRKYGRVFERLSQLYLLNEPKYSVIINKIWILDEVTLNVKEQINLPRKRDEGIDLIIETKNKEYWAVQSKFLSNPNKTLTRTKLNNFHSLAYVHCNDISHGIVLSTIINPPQKKELIDGVSYILIDAFKELDDKKCKKLEEYDIITDYSGRYFPKLTSNTIFQRVDKNDTINKCKNLCKSKNKEYAAIQDDNACFCGNANEIKNYTFTNNNVPLITKKRTFTKEIDTDLPPRCQWITYRANKPSVWECNPRSKKVLKEFDEYVTEPTPKWVEYNNSFDSNAKGPIILKSGESVNTYTGSGWQSSIHFLK